MPPILYILFLILLQYIFTKISNCIAHNVPQYATFQPAHRAMRSIAAGWNVGDGGVGTQ
jgi:hypothetical protein